MATKVGFRLTKHSGAPYWVTGGSANTANLNEPGLTIDSLTDYSVDPGQSIGVVLNPAVAGSPALISSPRVNKHRVFAVTYDTADVVQHGGESLPWTMSGDDPFEAVTTFIEIDDEDDPRYPGFDVRSGYTLIYASSGLPVWSLAWAAVSSLTVTAELDFSDWSTIARMTGDNSLEAMQTILSGYGVIDYEPPRVPAP